MFCQIFVYLGNTQYLSENSRTHHALSAIKRLDIELIFREILIVLRAKQILKSTQGPCLNI